jgi:hypothetical protein
MCVLIKASQSRLAIALSARNNRDTTKDSIRPRMDLEMLTAHLLWRTR